MYALACEIDYLGHKIEPGQTFADRPDLGQGLDSGTYQARVEVYAGCTLGEPQVISAGETNYGRFGDCQVRETVLSAPFEVR